MSARLQVLHLTSPLSRKELPTLLGLTTLGARRRSCRLTRRNRVLETMAGNAFSTRTGSAPSFALAPQTRVPVYASLVRTLWMLVLPQTFPAGLAMPSPLRVRVMSSIPLPASDIAKMRSTMGDVAGFGSRVGRFLGPSWT